MLSSSLLTTSSLSPISARSLFKNYNQQQRPKRPNKLNVESKEFRSNSVYLDTTSNNNNNNTKNDDLFIDVDMLSSAIAATNIKNPLLTDSLSSNSMNIRNLPIKRFTITYAIKKGYFNLVRYLLSLGVDPNYVSDTETHKRTALIYCTFIKEEKWALSVAQNLLEYGASLKETDSKYLNAIHYCCAFGLDKLLELLLNSLDFDLSTSFDLNGNNCMHYAIRSHNLKCVQLVIKKCKQSHLTKINVKNIFGLKPSDLEDDNQLSKNNNLKELNVFSGTSTLDECKKCLDDYIKYESSHLMEQQQHFKKLTKFDSTSILIYDDDNDGLLKEKKRNKKSKYYYKKDLLFSSSLSSSSSIMKKSKSILSMNTSNSRRKIQEDSTLSIKAAATDLEENSGVNSCFFKTQINDKLLVDSSLQGLNLVNSNIMNKSDKIDANNSLNDTSNLTNSKRAKTASAIKASFRNPQTSSTDYAISSGGGGIGAGGSSSNPNSSKPLQNEKKLNFNESNIQQRSKSASIISSKLNLNEQSNLPIEKPIDKEKAKLLTNKSFLINFKERLLHLIAYNNLFYAKEHMFESVLVKTNISNHIKLDNTNSSKDAYLKRPQTANNTAIMRSRKNSSKLSNLDDLTINSTDFLNDKHQIFTKSVYYMPNETILTDWKKEMPNVFRRLENLLTPSYRQTINPPLSAKIKYPIKSRRASKGFESHTTTSSAGKKHHTGTSNVSSFLNISHSATFHTSSMIEHTDHSNAQ